MASEINTYKDGQFSRETKSGKSRAKVPGKSAVDTGAVQRASLVPKLFSIVGRARDDFALPNKPRSRAEKMPVKAARKLAQELPVRQIELEKQNAELRRTQLKLERALDRHVDRYNFAPSAHLTLKSDGEILEANLAAARLLGMEQSRLIHQQFTRFVEAEAQDAFFLIRRQTFNADAPQSVELTVVNAKAEPVFVQLNAVRSQEQPQGQFHISLTDITTRKRAEERAVKLNRAKAIMAIINRAIVHASDRLELLNEICRLAVEKGGFKLAWIGMVTPAGTVQPVAQAGATGYLEGIRLVVAPDEAEGCGPVGTAIRENRPVVIGDIDQDARMAPWRDRAQKFGLRYAAAFPLRIEGKVAGSFQVHAPRADFFSTEELRLLTQVTDDISFVLTAMAEVGARKEAEANLRRSEHNLSIFFNQAPIGLEWLSASGVILRANQVQLNMLGCSSEEYMGRFFTEFCVNPALGLELLERLAARKTVQNFRLHLRGKDGAIRQVLVDAISFWNDNQFQYSSVFSRDITDRVNLEREILSIGEREQQRIAQDLHDGLGQVLVGVGYLTNNLQKDLATKSLPEARQSGRILEVINEAIAQTRSLARGLHPVEPEPNGLMSALEALATHTQKTFRVRCHFSCRQPVLVQDNSAATHLFRIAQEAITNAIKHGKPGRIEISLAKPPGRINLAVKDDGAGLPARQRKPAGIGLRIMRYRAGMIGGTLAIEKAAGGGTIVACTMPTSDEPGLKPVPPAGRKQNSSKKKKD
jgi:PAS domain S-box-containing protein